MFFFFFDFLGIRWGKFKFTELSKLRLQKQLKWEGDWITFLFIHCFSYEREEYFPS